MCVLTGQLGMHMCVHTYINRCNSLQVCIGRTGRGCTRDIGRTIGHLSIQSEHLHSCEC